MQELGVTRRATDRLRKRLAGPPGWCVAAGVGLALAVWGGARWRDGAAASVPYHEATTTVVHDARLLDLPTAWAHPSPSDSASPEPSTAPTSAGDDVLAAGVRARVVADSALRTATAVLPQDNSDAATTPSRGADELDDVRQTIRVGVARGGSGAEPPTLEVTIHCRQPSTQRALLLANTLAAQYAEGLRAAWRAARLEEYEAARLAAEAADEQLAQCAERLEAALRSAVFRQPSPGGPAGGGPAGDEVTDSSAPPGPLRPGEPAQSRSDGLPSPPATRSLPPHGSTPGPSPSRAAEPPTDQVPPAPAPLLADNPEWLDLARRVDDATKRRDAMLVDRTPSHPAVQALEHEIESLRARWAATPRWIPARRPLDPSLGRSVAPRPGVPGELAPAPTVAPALVPAPPAEPSVPALPEPADGAANRREGQRFLPVHGATDLLDGAVLPHDGAAAARAVALFAPAGGAAPRSGANRSISPSAPVVSGDRPGSLPGAGWSAKPVAALSGEMSEDFEALRIEMSRVEAARALAAARQQAAWKRLAEEPRVQVHPATLSRLDAPSGRRGAWRSVLAAALAGLALAIGLWWLSMAAAIEPVLESVEEIESFVGLPALGPIACASVATVGAGHGSARMVGAPQPIVAPLLTSSARLRWIAAGLAALVVASAAALVGLGLW